MYFEYLLFDIMQPAIRFVNSNNQYGLDAPIDIENARQVIAGQEVCNSVLASQRKNHLSQVTSDVSPVSNNKHRKYNH